MGYIYLYTGTGGGKTANALGLALRTVGHKRSVIIIQFMKWWRNTGEYKIRKALEPYYEIHQFGRKGWHGLNNLKEEDRKLARKALNFARQAMIGRKPHLLVLDEINLAVHTKLLNVNDVLALLDLVPKRTHVVLTGRFAPKELIERADFVNEVVALKYPEKIPTTKGVQY
ncbi:MAG TPA: cob(I)yrinic acid a,c-diamide adenosyltransferase [Candidatus Bathyarchaeia archaeon]|nr:cob(I)yrinic acid a,c-diamide adenosyltransferase [Candidatus Bathyarchaeia archaeon]